MTTELHCGLNDLEKGIVVAFSSCFIADNSENSENILFRIIDILEYSYNSYLRNLHAIETMMNMMGLNLLNTLRNASVKDKTYIKRAVDYAYNNGGDKNDAMYYLAYSIFEFDKL